MTGRVARAGVRRHFRTVVEHPWVERWSRFGFLVRGLIYVLPGVLALLLALGGRGAAISPLQAIELVGREPLGRVALAVLAVGLAGYSLWGAIRAVFDPLERGRSPHGIAKRLGYLSSALGYGSLFATTTRLLAGIEPRMSTARDGVARLLEAPLGPWLVGAIGLGWIGGAGVGEIAKAARGDFEKDLQLERMSRTERRVVLWLGRVGIAARGAVLAFIGVSLVVAAWHADAARERDFAEVLFALPRLPFGRWLLGAAALGLIAFGLFSLSCARWMRMRARGREAGASPFASSV
jgi:hypothetical protein